MVNTNKKEIRLAGISASPGICIGKAYLVHREGVDIIPQYRIDKTDLKNEIKRFKSAVKSAKDELRHIIENTPEELRQHTGILETHILLLKDKMTYGKTLELIEEELINAEWALKKVTGSIDSVFSKMSDPYLKERAADIVHVSDRIMHQLLGSEKVNIAEISKRVILVSRDLSPVDASQIKLERIMGVVTDRGGRDSHTGIIARSLEIPAVLGLENATVMIKNDDLIIVDGSTGVVIIHPADKTLFEYEEKKARFEQFQAAMIRSSRAEVQTLDGFRLKVMGNIDLPEEVVSVLDHGGDGIGLYRTEFEYLNAQDFPAEEELYENYRDVVEVMGAKPVTIRTLDINGDKRVYDPFSAEPNPALGLRAIRYCLKNPEVFKTQLRAILRAAAWGNVRILFPMISCVEEIREARRILSHVADDLDRDGIAYGRSIRVGIMIEVPSAVVMADELAKAIDFFSIGTNDLIQYALAIDRGNRDVAHLYTPLQPAIIRLLKQVSDVARDQGADCYMCGEMAGDPFHVPILLGLGIRELSMNPASIPAVKRAIRVLGHEDCRLFLKEVLCRTTAQEVRTLLQEAYGSLLNENTFEEETLQPGEPWPRKIPA